MPIQIKEEENVLSLLHSLRQYRYAKDYYRIVQEGLKKQGEEE